MASLIPLVKEVLGRVSSHVEPYQFRRVGGSTGNSFRRKRSDRLPNHFDRESESWVFAVDVALFLKPVDAWFKRVGLSAHVHLGANLGNPAGSGYREHRFWGTPSDVTTLEALLGSIETEVIPWLERFRDGQFLVATLTHEDKNAVALAPLAEMRIATAMAFAAALGDRDAALLSAQHFRTFERSGRSQLAELDRERCRALIALIETEFLAMPRTTLS